MSDMARARVLMARSRSKMLEAMALIDEAHDLSRKAEALTVRASPVRRAPMEMEFISSDMREAVIDLAETEMTMHQIAEQVGLRNGGRVSEILRGKR